MKKNIETPDSATSNQAFEHGSARAVTIPNTPVKIFTALNRVSFLHFYGADHNEIRITKKGNTAFQYWLFKYSEQAKAYQIQCFPFNAYMTAAGGGDVIATEDSGADNQFWTITDAGGHFVYIENLQYKKVLEVSRSSTEDDTYVLLDRKLWTNSQMFMLGAEPA
ncbi:RICIN domain-containing protein [Pseudomonas gingeri]|uniref:RICIN domain-containing protein n=1 Tax=Pseudomonas gingeri TaxID=117681 RepID=UPI0015A061A8|nr:RICIN domain-containing protein [Pseudomonas gingeri]NWA11730.1 RICIN domain-containing protein [Pseudomonas gingeri]